MRQAFALAFVLPRRGQNEPRPVSGSISVVANAGGKPAPV